MFIPKLVCIPCAMEMTISRTGARIELAHSNGHKFKVSSDVYACPTCANVTARLAAAASAEGWQPGYGIIQADINARFADDDLQRG